MTPIITVADYLTLINHALRTIPSEEAVIEGEVADYRVSQGKWVNFILKDEKQEAAIACFATVFSLSTPLADGMRVHVRGYPKVFERFGKLSLNVESVELVGEGALAKAYATLKAKLAAEGLFDAARKRPLPRFPDRIGVITSKEAAAYGDFLRILSNRWSGVTVLHAHVAVQGKDAVQNILDAFAQCNAMSADERPDVLVLTRGGGSLEDLHAFNDEAVARAVFQSVIPVVVGVGHERDESLCDFVADVRASTPSNAAERCVPDRGDILQSVVYAIDHMQTTFVHRVESASQRIERSIGMVDRFFSDMNTRLVQAERLLRSVDPVRVLDRGYAIVRANGVVAKNVSSLAAGDAIRVQLARGEFEALVRKGGSRARPVASNAQASML